MKCRLGMGRANARSACPRKLIASECYIAFLMVWMLFAMAVTVAKATDQGYDEPRLPTSPLVHQV
jgi:hypothetical protein